MSILAEYQSFARHGLGETQAKPTASVVWIGYNNPSFSISIFPIDDAKKSSLFHKVEHACTVPRPALSNTFGHQGGESSIEESQLQELQILTLP
jgi:hypothetical protein